jgi:predicted transcriptional regulator
MGKITIYLDDDSEAKMKAAAKASQLSASKWLAQLIRQELSTTQWPEEVRALVGAWPDFPSEQELRQSIGA